ncbi:BCCT family transporter [Cobetia amphilecti]|uniref:BCCT family transporter n=1 Tax=Cobetia amphilecti TaxID=1055104 RepID=UPI0032993C22
MRNTPAAGGGEDASAEPRTGLFAKVNPPVFFGANAIILLLVIFTAVFSDTAMSVFESVQHWITNTVSWFYILCVAIVLISVVYVGFSRHGEIRLGPDHSLPDYSNVTWFAMLFSAGMGIGLMFFGVAEPVMHFLNPPTGTPEQVETAREAMKLTFFHWGLHAWSIYAIVALILAYFSYRHDLPLTLRSALYPLIGKRIYGPIGHAVDIFAIVGTVCGVATTLGYGVAQVNAGLSHLTGMPNNDWTQVAIIVVITGLATISVVTGLDKGIRILSEINLGLAVVLLLFVLLLGPTAFLLKAFVQNSGFYMADIVGKTFELYAYEPNDWIGGWTLLYWGWWMSWSPFVGMFIARVSRGRTIREFVIGVLFVPAGFTLLWMTIFGNTAISMILEQNVTALVDTVNDNYSLALFTFLEQLPLSSITSVIALVMVIVFFVTSADSGSMVVDMLASGGREDTPIWQRIYWAFAVGLLAIVLMLAGGLGALQTATIATALPFGMILLAAIFGLLRQLNLESVKRRSLSVNTAAATPMGEKGNWRKRAQHLMSFPTRAMVRGFLRGTVAQGMQELAEELRSQGLEVDVTTSRDRVYFNARHGEEDDFIYGVRIRSHLRPDLNLDQEDEGDEEDYCRAEVFLKEGGQSYDLMGYSKDQVINDLLEQYERHMHYLHQLRLSQSVGQ